MWKRSEAIAIEAPPEVVYDVIADLGSYDQWNPWIIRASGRAEEGKVVRVTARLGARRMKVQHRILIARRGEAFRWCDLGWFTRLAYGERDRVLSPRSGGQGTDYRVELSVSGIGTRLVQGLLGRALADGLRAETWALKGRAESLHRDASQAAVNAGAHTVR
jgi:hypothetical protein